jgi:hypothetical protein
MIGLDLADHPFDVVAVVILSPAIVIRHLFEAIQLVLRSDDRAIVLQVLLPTISKLHEEQDGEEPDDEKKHAVPPELCTRPA